MSLMSAAGFTGGLLHTVAFYIILKSPHFLRLASSRAGDKEGFHFIKIPGDSDEHSLGARSFGEPSPVHPFSLFLNSSKPPITQSLDCLNVSFMKSSFSLWESF